MTILDILLLILIIVAIIVGVYVILTLKKVMVTMTSVEKDIHELSQKTIPLLENLNETSQKINYITNEAERHVEDFNSAIITVKEKIHSFTSEMSQQGSGPEFPASSLIKILTGISKGIAVFWSKYKKN